MEEEDNRTYVDIFVFLLPQKGAAQPALIVAESRSAWKRSKKGFPLVSQSPLPE